MANWLQWRRTRAMERGAVACAHARATWRRRAMSRDLAHELWADRDSVLAAVRYEASCLRYASNELRADREVVMAAVKKGGHALEYASAELRADAYVVLAAMQMNEPVWWYQYRGIDNGVHFKHAPDWLRANRAFVLAVVKQWADVQQSGACAALQHVPAELRADSRVLRLVKLSRKHPLDRNSLERTHRENVGSSGTGIFILPHHFGCNADERDLIALQENLIRIYARPVARDRDSLGAAVGARAIPAPHAALKLNGGRAPEALAIVHCLLARYVEEISSVGVHRTSSTSGVLQSRKLGFEGSIFALWGA